MSRFVTKMRKQLRDIKPDAKLGVIALRDSFGYQYIVPLTDRFYRTPSLAIPNFTVRNFEEGLYKDNPAFRNLRPSWIDALNQSFSDFEKSLVFLDIGAFVGAVSLHIAKHPNSDWWELHLFEPNPFNNVLCAANLHLNGFTDIVPSKCAVSDSEGSVKFLINDTSLASGRISTDGTGKDVPVTTIGAYLDESGITADHVFAKIDVLGCEWNVLRGISETWMSKLIGAIIDYRPTNDGVYEKWLVEHFEIFNIKSTLFSEPLPYQRLKNPDELKRLGLSQMSLSKNLDLLLVPRNESLPVREVFRACLK